MAMSVDAAARVTCACASCHADAAEFLALRTGEGTGLLGERLQRNGWFGQCERPRAYDAALAFVAEIRAGALAELARADRDLFGFFCHACAVVYCSACWTIGPPEFDDGFYDCTRGTCPAGHTQTLDD
jgi:hypothetical protein